MKLLSFFRAGVLAMLLVGPCSGFATNLPRVTQYRLHLRVLPKEGTLEGNARMTVFNEGSANISEVPLLLYRLLDVRKVTADDGASLAFTQKVTKLEDQPTLQANAVTIRLSRPLETKASTYVDVEYTGAVLGYSEVMAYVHDRVDEKYTLLRPDSFSYPLVAEPSLRSVFAAIDRPFTYEVAVEAPQGYVAACGGDSSSQIGRDNSTVFVCSSKAPNQRMDIAVAKFRVLSDSAGGSRVYAIPEDEAASANILKETKRVMEFYRSSFGEIDAKGYTVIEIPDGWGSQAAAGYILQTAAAFKDPLQVDELYHEIAHSWNLRTTREVQRCRYFDEAFASYFAALAIRHFRGEPAFREHMEESRKIFVRGVGKEPRNATTPIAEYGRYELGGNSYTKGAWSLYVLNELIGTEAFNQTVRRLLQDYRTRDVGFKDFLDVAASVSGKDLKKFAQEWLYGADSSQLLTEAQPVSTTVSRYR